MNTTYEDRIASERYRESQTRDTYRSEDTELRNLVDIVKRNHERLKSVPWSLTKGALGLPGLLKFVKEETKEHDCGIGTHLAASNDIIMFQGNGRIFIYRFDKVHGIMEHCTMEESRYFDKDDRIIPKYTERDPLFYTVLGGLRR